MDFLELSRAQFSVLEYEHRPVEQDKLDKIIDAGLAARRLATINPNES